MTSVEISGIMFVNFLSDREWVCACVRVLVRVCVSVCEIDNAVITYSNLT